ncbi:unnamed protein product [Klebsiella pneumoniae]|nr:unnamed protein product [Klebsiella pneumoniae]
MLWNTENRAAPSSRIVLKYLMWREWMGYITYVTDQRPGEPDILTGNTFADLEICDSDGHLLLKVSAPEAGWTHESLNLVQPQEVQEGNDAFDAYLNGIWIGSTEV